MTNLDPNRVPLSTAAADAQSTAPHKAPDDTEEIYYEGSPLLRGSLGKGFLWIFGGLLLIALSIASPILKWPLPWWACLALAVIGLIFILVPLIRSKTIRYRVTNYRIDYERGLFGKNIDTLELWHVEDLHFHQSLLDRMLDVGTITVLSKDDSMPTLELFGLPNPRPLYETLKQRVIAVKRQRGVVKMDPG